MSTQHSVEERFPVAVRIIRRCLEADDVISLDLRDPQGRELPEFEAGASIEVPIEPGLVRQYSLSNQPSERHRYRLAILREPQSRGGSAAIHDLFHEGMDLRISLPRNNFKLVETAQRSIFLAGGIGVTPLLAMAYRLHAIGSAFEFHYFARCRSRAAFTFEIETSPFAKFACFSFDDEKRGGPPDLSCLNKIETGTHVYICGPDGFMNFVTSYAQAHGWNSTHVHKEHFSGTADAGGASFKVIAARSGKEAIVGENMTIAFALMEVGVVSLISCGEGICGTCLTRVIEGEPDHRDNVQSDSEKAQGDMIAVCCSRAKTQKLVLDI